MSVAARAEVDHEEDGDQRVFHRVWCAVKHPHLLGCWVRSGLLACCRWCALCSLNPWLAAGEANRYTINEVIGKGSYGVVCSALDTKTGEKVAIKRIMNVFDHVSDATRILREIKLLRLLRHPGASQGVAKPHCANTCAPVKTWILCTGWTPSANTTCRHCGDQAHHAASKPARVQGHLRGVRAHGDRPPPGAWTL